MKGQMKLFNATYLLLILVNLVTAFGYSMIATLITSYALRLGAGLTLTGIGYFRLGQILAQICGPNVGIAIKDLLFHALTVSRAVIAALILIR